jgi:hypothetical protein
VPGLGRRAVRDDAVAVDAGLRGVHLPLLPSVEAADQVDLPGERVQAGALAEVEERGQFRGGDLVVDAGLLEYGLLVRGPVRLVGADGERAGRLGEFGAHGRTSFRELRV